MSWSHRLDFFFLDHISGRINHSEFRFSILAIFYFVDKLVKISCPRHSTVVLLVLFPRRHSLLQFVPTYCALVFTPFLGDEVKEQLPLRRVTKGGRGVRRSELVHNFYYILWIWLM